MLILRKFFIGLQGEIWRKARQKQEIKIELNNRNYPKGFPLDTSLINYPNPEGFFIESSEKIGF
jgi:hypothetical protein